MKATLMRWIVLFGCLSVSTASAQNITGVVPAVLNVRLNTNGNTNFPVKGFGTLGIYLSGTWSATVKVYCSPDGLTQGTNTIQLAPPDTGVAVTSVSSNGTWVGSIAGCASAMVNVSGYVSGTIIVQAEATMGGGAGGAGGSGGTVTLSPQTGASGSPLYMHPDPSQSATQPMPVILSDGSNYLPTTPAGQVATGTLLTGITGNTTPNTGGATDVTVTGYGVAFITLNCASCGSTPSGTTISLTVSGDGSNFTAWPMRSTDTGQVANSVTPVSGYSQWRVEVAGQQKIRLAVSAYSAGTVGATVVMIPGNGTDPPFVGCTPYYYIAAASANQDSQVIKASGGTLVALVVENMVSALRYVKVYDSATAPTSGSTPKFDLMVPHNSGNGAGFVFPMPPTGMTFVGGLAFRMTTGLAANDANAVTANDLVLNACYR